MVSSSEEAMNCESRPDNSHSSLEVFSCIKRLPLREWLHTFWSYLLPSCGGCLQPTMTLRLLGSFVLVSGVMVSSAEGSMLVREEQRYQRCLLRQEGFVGDRFMMQPPQKGDAQDLMECYPHNIHFVRASAGLGVMLLLLLILATMLMFVAVSTDRWCLTLPWAYGCIFLIAQELILIIGCWRLLGYGDVVLYAIHLILLSYCAAALHSTLKMVECEEETSKDYNSDV